MGTHSVQPTPKNKSYSLDREHMVPTKTKRKGQEYNGSYHCHTWDKKYQIKVANMCRIYFKVIMISDLTNINGNSIPPGRLTGKWQRKSNLEWPELPKPPPKSWEEFRQMMRKAFETANRIYNQGAEMQMKTSLGKWLNCKSHI